MQEDRRQVKETMKKNRGSQRKAARSKGKSAGSAGATFPDMARQLSEVGRGFYARGWVMGTSGNFSVAISDKPLRLVITSTGLDKGNLTPKDFLEIDVDSKVVKGKGRPSAETLLHLAIVRARRAGAVLHTHSVWSTVLSGSHAAKGGVLVDGYEMLKGLDGVKTHEHREWLPILENSQDMEELARKVSKTLEDQREIHGFLLREHGLYTWGRDLQEARRHVEILEFLMEVVVRARAVANES